MFLTAGSHFPLPRVVHKRANVRKSSTSGSPIRLAHSRDLICLPHRVIPAPVGWESPAELPAPNIIFETESWTSNESCHTFDWPRIMFLTAGSNFPLPRLVYKRRMCANQTRQALQLDLPILEIRMTPHTHTRLKCWMKYIPRSNLIPSQFRKPHGIYVTCINTASHIRINNSPA